MFLQGWVNGILINESSVYGTLCIVLLKILNMGLYFSEIDTRGWRQDLLLPFNHSFAHFIILLPVLNSFKCLIIHYTTFVRKDFKPFCVKFRPVGLKSLNKTFLSYEKSSFCERNVPFAKGTFLSVYSHTGTRCSY